MGKKTKRKRIFLSFGKFNRRLHHFFFDYFFVLVYTDVLYSFDIIVFLRVLFLVETQVKNRYSEEKCKE